jgi:phosphohistidine phosphatase
MKLLAIRHAIAEDKDEFAKTGKDDRERPLSKEGRTKMRKAAAGLRTVVGHIDILASSSLVRAVETTEIVRPAFGGIAFSQIAALEPEKPVADVLEWLRMQPAGATVAIVGHEPQLGVLVSWLLTGQDKSFVKLRKGSATLLQFAQNIDAGAATLLWMLKPSQLRALAG